MAALESRNRDMQVQMLRTGGNSDSVSLASMTQPQGRTPTLGRCLTPPMNDSFSGVAPTDEHNEEVNRELDFGATSSDFDDPGHVRRGRAGERCRCCSTAPYAVRCEPAAVTPVMSH